MVFGFFENKTVSKISDKLLSKYGTEDGTMNLIYDATNKRFKAVPKGGSHAEEISGLLNVEKEELMNSEEAKRMVPLIVEFNDNNKITRLVTGFSSSVERLGELTFNPDDVKFAHAAMMQMIYSSRMNAGTIKEKMF